jgi:hypothetical protein
MATKKLLRWDCPKCKTSISPIDMTKIRNDPKKECKICGKNKIDDFKPVYLYEHGKPYIVRDGKEIKT